MSQNTSSQPNSKPAEKKKRTGPKKPKKITENYLHNSGLYYLERFASSRANFIDVMMRKVKKSCAFHKDQDFEKCKQMVETLAQKFVDLELLNDDAYTRSKVRSLRNKGKSKKYILGHLRVKGIANDLTQKHLALYDEEHGNDDHKTELEAAMTFARKKRIGPFRKEKEEAPEKELGKMARAGFSYDTAKQVLHKNKDDISKY